MYDVVVVVVVVLRKGKKKRRKRGKEREKTPDKVKKHSWNKKKMNGSRYRTLHTMYSIGRRNERERWSPG